MNIEVTKKTQVCDKCHKEVATLNALPYSSLQLCDKCLMVHLGKESSTENKNTAQKKRSATYGKGSICWDSRKNYWVFYCMDYSTGKRKGIILRKRDEDGFFQLCRTRLEAEKCAEIIRTWLEAKYYIKYTKAYVTLWLTVMKKLDFED